MLPDELGLLGEDRSTAEPVPLRSGPLGRLSGSARSALPRCAQAGVTLSANAVTPTATSNLPRVMTTLLALELQRFCHRQSCGFVEILTFYRASAAKVSFFWNTPVLVSSPRRRAPPAGAPAARLGEVQARRNRQVLLIRSPF